jgi:hypothetical protein
MYWKLLVHKVLAEYRHGYGGTDINETAEAKYPIADNARKLDCAQKRWICSNILNIYIKFYDTASAWIAASLLI